MVFKSARKLMEGRSCFDMKTRIQAALVLIILLLSLVTGCWNNSEPFARETDLENSKPQGQSVTFSDPCFEAAIRTLLNKENEDIQSHELAYIDALYIHGNTICINDEYVQFTDPENRITDLADLKWFASLTHLEIVDNEISNLKPLAELKKLTYLVLDFNEIQDLSPLAGLTDLSVLSLKGNQIDDLNPLKSLLNLRSLELDSNRISDTAPLANLTSLEHLSLRDNAISYLRPLPNALRSLDLSHNLISDLGPLTGLTGLKYLNLDTNQITNIYRLTTLTNLSYLNLNSNLIDDLSPLTQLTGLVHLEVCDNPITDWSPVDHVKVVIGETEYLIHLGMKIVEAIFAGDHVFLQDNTRNMEVSCEGISYFFSGEKIEFPFETGGPHRVIQKVRFVSKGTDGKVKVGFEISDETYENTGVLHIGFVKRQGVWKMESFETDI